MGWLNPNDSQLLPRLDRHVNNNYMCYAVALRVKDPNELNLLLDTVTDLGLQYYRPQIKGQLVDEIVWVVFDFRYVNVKYNYDTVKSFLAAVQSDPGVMIASFDHPGDEAWFHRYIDQTYQGRWFDASQYINNRFWGDWCLDTMIEDVVDHKSLNDRKVPGHFDGDLDLQYLLGHDLKIVALPWGSESLSMFAAGQTLFYYLPFNLLTKRLYSYILCNPQMGMVMMTVSGFDQLAPFLDRMTKQLVTNH